MAYKRKYKKGEQITSIDELMEQEFIYCHHKVTHKGWFGSWQLRFAKQMIERGILFKAIKREGEADGEV